MKKVVKIILFALLTSVFSVNFVSCSDDDDDDDGGASSVTSLPESTGTDEISGKTWSQTNDDNTTTLKFSSGTLTWTISGSVYECVDTYNYTYDSANKLIYLALTKQAMTTGSQTASWTSASECSSVMSKSGGSGARLEDIVASTNAEFVTKKIFKYTISGTSLILEDYFGGTLPTMATFYGSNFQHELREGYITLEDSSSDDKYNVYATFSNGSFSGKVYKETQSLEYTSLGTASGTYTVSGKGTSGGTVTLTFTSLPSGVSVVTANTAIELTQSADSKTYTLQ